MGNNYIKMEVMNAELEDIFESSFDEIFLTDHNGIVLRANSVSEKNYNIPVNQIIGKHVKNLEKEGIFYPSATLKVIKTLHPIETFQKTIKGQYLHVRTRPIFDKEGKLIRVISYSRDLTELIQIKKKMEGMEEKLESYKKEINKVTELTGIISKSPKMKNIVALVDRVANVDSTVLVLGETGVGKSMFVKTIHQLSNRKNEVLNEINCAALPEQLIESELFGYESGTFTGANRQGKKGLIELSHKGTFFLDEVGELPLHLQGKLLQVIQEKEVRPLGGKKTIPVDVRIISATNNNLEEMVEKGQFRKDLYYRLNVIPITIPPLRERTEDILPLIYQNLEKFNEKYRRKVHFSPKVLDVFLNYEWEGNCREVENLIERLVITTIKEEITVSDLPQRILCKSKQGKNQSKNKTLQEAIEELEKELILDAYENYKSSYKVAEVLGISQSAATRRVRKYREQQIERGNSL